MNKKFAGIAAMIFALTLIISCHKNDVEKPLPPPPALDTATIMGFKDSTQLIKSITGYFLDSSSNIPNDSSRALFRYDTVNKRITVIADLPSSEGIDFDSIVYQYNNDLMLTRLSYVKTASASYPDDILSVEYKYDADKVIERAIFSEYGGDKYTYSFNKTMLAGGAYRLRWVDTGPYVEPGTTYLASFNNQGQMVSNYYFLYSDSLIYDLVGNLKKVLRTDYIKAYDQNGSKTFTLYDFTTRDAKGDQLYNLYQVLNNGIAGFNVFNGSLGNDLFNVEYVYQYSKYPATSTIVHRFRPYDPNCQQCADYEITSVSKPVYDEKGRLSRYKVFFNDFPLTYSDFYIKYYK